MVNMWCVRSSGFVTFQLLLIDDVVSTGRFLETQNYGIAPMNFCLRGLRIQMPSILAALSLGSGEGSSRHSLCYITPVVLIHILIQGVRWKSRCRSIRMDGHRVYPLPA